MEAFLDWLDAGDYPAVMSGASVTREQAATVSKAAGQWATVLWNDDLDKRRQISTDFAVRRLSELLDHALPEHRLPRESVRQLVVFLLESDVHFGKRSTEFGTARCVDCGLGMTLILAHVGLALGWGLLTRRSVYLTGQPRPIWFLIAVRVWQLLAEAYGGLDLPNMTTVEKAYVVARAAYAAYQLSSGTWELALTLCENVVGCRHPTPVPPR